MRAADASWKSHFAPFFNRFIWLQILEVADAELWQSCA